MPTYTGTKPGATSASTAGPPASILKAASQSKRKSPVFGDKITTSATPAATVGTPTDCGNKAARPQGTSPMARDTDDDLDIQPLDLGIEGDGETSANDEDQNSVSREI
jgi:hypothetical protein